MQWSERAALFRRGVLRWFRDEARDLPWRRTSDPYRIWLSEIMLQQTRVDQGLPYYERFLDAFPDVHALAEAPLDRVLKQWEGLGYYTRARNLHKAARLVAERHDGELPRHADALKLLPGIGPYTAGAIASIAFDEAVPVVDGNVMRVLSRVFDIATCIDEPAGRKELWQLAGRLVPHKQPGDYNQAVMELGARICTPTAPRCEECPVQKACSAAAQGIQTERPVRRKKPPVPEREQVAAAIQDKSGCYLIVQRPPEGLLGGLWEFPAGPIAPGESHAQALTRVCREDFGIDVQAHGLIAAVRHAYTHFRLTLSVYRCTLHTGTPAARIHTAVAWAAPDAFDAYAFPKANHKFLPLLKGDCLF